MMKFYCTNCKKELPKEKMEQYCSEECAKDLPSEVGKLIELYNKQKGESLMNLRERLKKLNEEKREALKNNPRYDIDSMADGDGYVRLYFVDVDHLNSYFDGEEDNEYIASTERFFPEDVVYPLHKDYIEKLSGGFTLAHLRPYNNGDNEEKKEKRSYKDIFNDFQNLKFAIQRMSAIVQNEGISIPEEQMHEWREDVDNTINKIKELREEVIDYYKN